MRAMPASVAGNFFERLDGALGLGVVLRPGGELAVADGAHLAAQRLRRDRDTEFLPQPLAKIAQPPTHNAMDRRDRAAVDLRCQRLAVLVAQQRGAARRLAAAQPVRPLGVEPYHPVAHDLQGDVAKLRRLRAHAAVVDRRQCQQTTGLRGILAPPCQPPQVRRAEIRTQGDGTRHGEPPMLTSLKHITPASGNPPRESRPLGVGITLRS